jgi:hypothetical protein
MREFYDIVQAATDEQRHVLGELIGSGLGSQPDTLCDHIKYLWAGALGSSSSQAPSSFVIKMRKPA